MTFKEGWYVIYTKPRHEKQVYQKLVQAEIDAFLPIRKDLRKWWDRSKIIEVPLFPSYLFVKLINFKQYYLSIAIEGVLYFIKNGQEISQVTENVISSIKSILEKNIPFDIVSEKFEIGEKLLITSGPFRGLICELHQNKGKQNAMVNISVLHRTIILSLPVESLECIS